MLNEKNVKDRISKVDKFFVLFISDLKELRNSTDKNVKGKSNWFYG